MDPQLVGDLLNGEATVLQGGVTLQLDEKADGAEATLKTAAFDALLTHLHPPSEARVPMTRG